MPPTSPRSKAILQAIFVTILWSTSWVLIEIGLRNNLPPLTFAGLRYPLAFLCLAPFVPFQHTPVECAETAHALRMGKLPLLGVVYYTITQSVVFLALPILPVKMVSLPLKT